MRSPGPVDALYCDVNALYCDVDVLYCDVDEHYCDVDEVVHIGLFLIRCAKMI